MDANRRSQAVKSTQVYNECLRLDFGDALEEEKCEVWALVFVTAERLCHHTDASYLEGFVVR